MRGTKICPKCKKEFSPLRKNGQVYGKKQYNVIKYCSISCAKKGRKLTEEHKRKIRENHKGMSGKYHSEETKKKIRKAHKGRATPWNTGERCNWWKGGISKLKIYKHYRNAKYLGWREQVFERDDWTCQKCGNRSSKENPVMIHPHHIKSYTYYPKLRYEIDNGITLCVPCHHQIHFGH